MDRKVIEEWLKKVEAMTYSNSSMSEAPPAVVAYAAGFSDPPRGPSTSGVTLSYSLPDFEEEDEEEEEESLEEFLQRILLEALAQETGLASSDPDTMINSIAKESAKLSSDRETVARLAIIRALYALIPDQD